MYYFMHRPSLEVYIRDLNNFFCQLHVSKINQVTNWLDIAFKKKTGDGSLKNKFYTYFF